MSEWQSTYPPPPPHYTEAATLAPPSAPLNAETLLVYGRPLIQSFEGLQAKMSESFGALPEGSEALTRRELLKRLNMSVLFNFLEFVQVLHENPAEWNKKFEDLKQLLFNMHTVINSYRPHQARTLLIAQLQQQIARRRELLQLITRKSEAAQTILDQAAVKLAATNTAAPPSQAMDVVMENTTTPTNTLEKQSGEQRHAPAAQHKKGILAMMATLNSLASTPN